MCLPMLLASLLGDPYPQVQQQALFVIGNLLLFNLFSASLLSNFNDDDDGRKEFDRIREKHLKTSETKAWSEDKFAGGSYTHPSVGCDDARGQRGLQPNDGQDKGT